MQYRDQDFQYEMYKDEPGAESARELSAGQQYRTKRSAKPARRKAPKISHPGHGISGRRNRRWNW